jgi:hypothetical protein
MGRTLQIGQNACYWSAGASKALPALTVDCDRDGQATLVIFTAAGGRFVKTVGPLNFPGEEGWTEVGQRVVG